MNKKYVVLFGTGKIGKVACRIMKTFCDDSCLLFCDNNIEKVNTVVDGIKVCSFDEVVSLYNEGEVSRIIISAGGNNLDEILIQCLEVGFSMDELWAVNEKGEIVRPERVYVQDNYSQSGEDIHIMNYFSKKDNGVYVDVGANHPYCCSNTYWAYKKEGWKGINIEPDINNYNKLCKLRCNDINLNVGVSDCKAEMQYFAYECAAYNTFSKERMYELQNRGMECDVLNVQVITLQEIFDQYKIEYIDFIDLDVEGMEIRVLNGIDFNKTWIDILLIEQLGTSFEAVLESDIYLYMKERGFYPIGKYGPTVVYKNAREVDISMH